METPPRSTKAPAGTHADAAGRAWRLSPGRLAAGLLLAIIGAGALWLWLMPIASEPAGAVPPAGAVTPITAASGAPGPSPKSATAVPKALIPDPEGDADPTADLSSHLPRGANPSMGEVIEGLHQRGIRTGLGAFSPPGTSPPLVGLAVPADFVLPKGYVRHHQATDDGQPIEAILMFAPDFQLLDANGRPLPLPASRVVPPELAPPGLPIRRIVIPPNIATPNPAR